MTATATITRQALDLIESVVGDVEAANHNLEDVERGEDALHVGNTSLDGCLVVHPNDVVTVWAQGTAAEQAQLPGAYEHFAALAPVTVESAENTLVEDEGYDRGDVRAAIDSLIESGLEVESDEGNVLTESEIQVVREQLRSGAPTIDGDALAAALNSGADIDWGAGRVTIAGHDYDIDLGATEQLGDERRLDPAGAIVLEGGAAAVSHGAGWHAADA